MAVIDELVIAFSSDNDELKKGLKESEKAVSQFADDAKNKFSEVGNAIQTAFKAYFSFTALKNLTFDFAKQTNDLADKAELVGAKAGDIEMLGNALARFGGNADDAVGAMKSLNNAVVQLRTGGGAFVEIAKQFGIWVKPTKDGNEALLQVGKQLGKLSLKNRIAVAQQLGLSDSLVRAFADGGEELTRLLERQKELGAVTEDDVNASKRFNGAWMDLQDTFGAVRRDIARLLLPIATKIIDAITGFVDYLRKHRILVVGFFAALAVAMAPVLKSLTLMVIKVMLLAAPFIKLTAIITAVVLIFEDLYYFFKGWDSATGDLVKKFPFLAKFLEPVRPIVMGIVDAFDKIIEFFKNPSWASFSDILKEIGAVIANAIAAPFKFISQLLDSLIKEFPSLTIALQPFKDLVDLIADGWEKIAGFIKSISLDGVKDLANNAWGGVKDFFGFGDNEKENAIKQTTTAQRQIADKTKTNDFDFKDNEKENAIKQTTKTQEQIASKTGANQVKQLRVNSPALIKIDEVKVNADAPLMPAQASVINNNSTANSSNVTNNNNFNNTFNVTNATPKQFVAQAAPAIIRSIDAQTQQAGRL